MERRTLRRLAVHILTDVLKGTRLDEVLDQRTKEQRPPLETNELAWIRDVCSGFLRWKGIIDFLLDRHSDRKKPSGRLRKILGIALYQILAQRKVTPARVVDEVVGEIKEQEGAPPSRFANALLRKIIASLEILETETDFSRVNPKQLLEWAPQSLPLWLWKKLKSERRDQWTREYALACLDRPRLWLRMRDFDWVCEGASSGPIPKSKQWGTSGGEQQSAGVNVTRLPGFQEGAFIVQDISNQIVVHEVTQILRESRASFQKPLTMLDLCAAPGGKTIAMAWNGFEVTATDFNKERLKRLDENLNRVKLPNVKVEDYERIKTDPKQMDLVWVDAPCSSTGVIRRHPEIRWFKEAEDLKALNEIQIDLVRQAWKSVVTGGYLVYSVCSVLSEEQMKIVHEAGLESQVVKVWDMGPHEPPHGDGFWAVLLRKTS